MSSLLYIVAGVVGVVLHAKLPIKVQCAFVGVVMVGVGSTLFHGTLKYSMQLLDELPMLFTTLYMISCFCSKPISMALLVFGILFAAFYVANQSPFAFQLVFGVLQNVGLAIYFVGVKQSKDMNLRKIFVASIVFSAIAFCVWNIDNMVCHSHLRPWKNVSWVASLLELHAWWHVFTCISAYCFVVGLSSLIPEVQELKPRIQFKGILRLPTIVVASSYNRL